MVVGACFLTVGQGVLFRFVTALIGAIIGLAWSKPVITQLALPDFSGSEQVYAAVLGAVGLSIPEAVLFLVLAIPAAFASMAYLGLKNPLLGFVPAFLLGGAVGLILQNHIRAFVASALGAWMLVMGVLASLYRLGWVSQSVLGSPRAILGAIAFLALGGTLFQMSFRGKQQWRARRKAEKTRLKTLAEDRAALERRWASYSKDKLPKV
jgi:predicted Rdx family selenoprotein